MTSLEDHDVPGCDGRQLLFFGRLTSLKGISPNELQGVWDSAEKREWECVCACERVLQRERQRQRQRLRKRHR